VVDIIILIAHFSTASTVLAIFPAIFLAIVTHIYDKVSEDWNLINNQIFLGVLGSSIIPRNEMEKLVETFDEAGVRFVYFSPRNMRRTKELASQIGIDVAWNCAISLRDLDEGEEDPHRMLSEYADGSKNAKLPNGRQCPTSCQYLHRCYKRID